MYKKYKWPRHADLNNMIPYVFNNLYEMALYINNFIE